MATAGSIMIYIGANTAGLSAAEKRARLFRNNMLSMSKSVGSGITSLGRSIMGLAIPFAVIGGAATKMFSDFEYELAKVEGLVGINKRVVQEWGAAILKMAPEVGRTPKELAEALYFVTSAGIRGAETMEVLDMSAKAAAAGIGTAKDAADAITSAMNAYGKENLSAAEAADILIMAVREGKVVADDLAKSIGKVFPIAAQLGVSFNEVGAGIAAMTRTGTPASTSAIYLRRVLSTMLRPTNAARDALESLGGSFYDLRQTLQGPGGLLKALLKIRTLVDEYGEEEVAQVFPNIRALMPVLDLIGKNLEDNKKLWGNMLNPVEALGHGFNAVTRTLKQKWNQAVSDASVSMIKMGETLKTSMIAVLRDVVDWIEKAVNWWISLDDATKQLIIRIGLLSAVIGPLLIIMGGIVTAITSIVGLVTGLLGQILMVTVAVGMLISFMHQLNDMQSATAGAEDGVDRTQTALEKFSSNVGAYFIVILKRIKIFAIKVHIIFANLLEELYDQMAPLTLLVNSLIGVYNFIMPTKLFDLPKFADDLGVGEYYKKQLLAAEKELKGYEELLPGGVNSWNWADQLFGEGSGLKEAGAEVWDGFKSDALEAIDLIKNKLLELMPKMGGGGAKGDAPFIGGFEMLGKGTISAGEILANLDNERTLKSMQHLKVEDFTKQWKKFNIQVQNAGKEFEVMGFMIDPTAKKMKALEELRRKMLERKGKLGFFDLQRLQNEYGIIQREAALYAMVKEQEGYVDAEKLNDLYKYLEGLNLTKTEIEGIQTVMQMLSSSNFFSPERLAEMMQHVAQLKLTNTEMKRMLMIADALAPVFTSLGESIGKAMVGAEDAFGGLRDALINTIKSIGSMLVKFGLILGLLGFPIGWAMVGGGIALAAAAAVFQENEKGANLAMGGIVPDGYSGDRFKANLSSQEAVIPLDTLWTELRNAFGGSNQQKVVFHIDGTQLTGVLDKQNKIYNAF